MAFSLKKWIGSQLFSAFLAEYNQNMGDIEDKIDEIDGDIEDQANALLGFFPPVYITDNPDPASYVTNLNTINKTSFGYCHMGTTGLPSGANTYGLIITIINVAGSQASQFYHDRYNAFYTRRMWGGTWTAWVKLT